jgi:hypothetical protein
MTGTTTASKTTQKQKLLEALICTELRINKASQKSAFISANRRILYHRLTYT